MHFCNNNIMLETVLCLVCYAQLFISEFSQLCFFKTLTVYMLTNHEEPVYHAARAKRKCCHHANVTIVISYSREYYKICLSPKNVAFLLKGKIPQFSNNHPTKSPNIQFEPKLTFDSLPLSNIATS